MESSGSDAGRRMWRRTALQVQCHRYPCKDCGRSSNEESGLQLREWVYIIRIFQKSRSVLAISQDLGRNWRTMDSTVKKIANMAANCTMFYL